MEWIDTTLKNVAYVQGGFAFSSLMFVSEGIPVIRIGDINDDVINIENAARINDENIHRYKDVRLEENDILIALTGATVGKTGEVKKNDLPCLLNQRVGRFRIKNKNIIEKGWIKYWLKLNTIRQQIINNAYGGGQPNISPKQIESLIIPLPTPTEQRRIVDLLNQADEIRKLRKQADEKAERIIPALFYEMFGDPHSNPKGWDQMTLGKTGSKVRYGLGQPPKLSTDGIPMLRATNISRGTITTKDLIYVIEEAVPKSKNAFLASNEVLVVRSGAYTGDVAQVTNDWEGSIAGYDLVITPSDKLIGEFVESYLLTDYVQNHYFKNLKVRGGQPHLNAEQLLATPFYVPSKPTQEKYSFYLNKMRANRKSVELAKGKFENLFSKLLSDAFTGELTKSWREAHMKELLQEMEEQKKYLEKVN